jgi:elongation factor Ts
MIGAQDVQKLREITGAGVMECKKALVDAQGNFEKAVSLVRERGLARAETKKARVVQAGVVESYVHNDRVGVLLVVHCETDFVARSAPFRELAHNLAMQIAAMDPADVQTLLNQNYIKDERKTVGELIKETIAQVGENIQVEKFIRYEI